MVTLPTVTSSEPRPMPDVLPLDPTSRGSLLEELDARQDEVLAGLDELNKRLEQVLNAWSNRPTLADAA